MADRRHAEVPEVLGRQLGQACLIDRIFPECLPIEMSMTFTRTLGRTHPLVTTAGTSANEELSLPQPAVMRTFFGPWSAGIRGPMPGASPTIPTRFSLADGVIG